ncbi:MAG: DUF192 domain-containing protein [Pseudomonadota bacterium]
MMQAPRGFAALVVSLLILLPLTSAVASELEALRVVRGDGTGIDFKVEVARDPESRSQGLMHRRMMPFDHGMLFDFQRDRPVSMWMKNTYLSLDMFFIDREGNITDIARDTEPLSTKTISSSVPVRAVLELNAGSAERYNIEVGNRVVHPMFK